MQLSYASVLLALAACATAKLHKNAVCVQGRRTAPVGGTPFSPSFTWSKDYEIDAHATHCACAHYKRRNTGNKWWDSCPDCKFKDIVCVSNAGHIGGDEFTYYCEKKCNAQGAEAD